MFEALVCTELEALTQKANELEGSPQPDEATLSWFRAWIAFAQGQRGVIATMAAAHSNPAFALYAACAAVRSASARLLTRAQEEGKARADVNGNDMFGLKSALGWLIDLPSFAPRADHLVQIVTHAILAIPSSKESRRQCLEQRVHLNCHRQQ